MKHNYVVASVVLLLGHLPALASSWTPSLPRNTDAWTKKEGKCRKNTEGSVLSDVRLASQRPSIHGSPKQTRSQQHLSRSTATLYMAESDRSESRLDENAASYSATSSTASKSSTPFKIRQCEYSELGQVADIIMESFYEESGMWKRLYQLAELNRLQQNFAYADQSKVHQMLVAEVNDNNNSPNIAGFVDIDTRPLPPEFSFPQPRPYLSDLCTLKAYRRQGLAKALVEQCEAFCMNHNKRELFIRVQEHNVAALTMYQRLGYDVVSKALDETSQKARENNQMICTLRKAL